MSMKGLIGKTEDQFHENLSVANHHFERIILSLELVKQFAYCLNKKKKL